MAGITHDAPPTASSGATDATSVAADTDAAVAAIVEALRPRVRDVLAAADLASVSTKQARRSLLPYLPPGLDLDGPLKPAINALIADVFEEFHQSSQSSTGKTSQPTTAASATTAPAAPAVKPALVKNESIDSAPSSLSVVGRRSGKSDDLVDDDDEDGEDGDVGDEDGEADGDPGEDSKPDARTRRKRPLSGSAAAASSKKPAAKRARTGTGRGFGPPMVVSPALAAVVGSAEAATTDGGGGGGLTRSEVVKRIWAYIKERGLQDPADGRRILCDDALRAVFKADRVNCFRMNKLISAHLRRPEDLANGDVGNEDEDEEDENADGNDDGDGNGDDDDDDEPSSRRAKRPRQKPAKKPAARGKPGAARGGLAKLLHPSAQLAAIVGAPDPLTRPQTVKRIWDYIKAHDLQDPADRRFILCDPPLAAVFDGNMRVSSFQMNKFLSAHFVAAPADAAPAGPDAAAIAAVLVSAAAGDGIAHLATQASADTPTSAT
ncbi:hypothetical protein HK405_010581 [Cladochytrium tenue]|nr:hypothetical protein HK405_010581 [Cladochytrium tenue]